jgi:alpha-beta hydrolase superfamily lysophospholipase
MSEADVVAEARQWFNHEQKLSGYGNPVLILHAEQDGLVDISHAERNFRWAASPQKMFVRFPVGNHNTVLVQNHAEYFRSVAEFVSGVVHS